jgi:hypothetical protein
MFHRTNLTLSARTLTNRLNLGTRSLALVANVKNNGRTLRTRHTHHDVLREGMVWYDMFTIMPQGSIIPTIPGPLSQQQCQPGRLNGQPGPVAEDVRVIPDPRPADLVGRPEPCVRVGVVGVLPPPVVVSERSSRSSERSSGSRSAAAETARKPASKRAAGRAARATAAAAISAASTGK